MNERRADCGFYCRSGIPSIETPKLLKSMRRSAAHGAPSVFLWPNGQSLKKMRSGMSV
jgi:hypothetical protein